MNIHKAITECLETAFAIRAYETAKTYKSGLDWFAKMLAEDRDLQTADVTAVTMKDFTRFPVWLRKEKKFAKATVRVYLAGARNFMRWLTTNEYLLPDYAATVRYQDAVKEVGLMRESKLPRFPERDHVARMQEAVRILPYKSPRRERNLAMIEFMACTGCRVSEMTNLTISKFSPDYSSAIVTGKGKKERRVFLSEAARELLLDYWKVRGAALLPTTPAFSRHDKGAGKRVSMLTTAAVRQMVEEVSNMAGIDNFSPHYFRHAFAIRVLGETGNLALTQDLMGHKTPAATRNYAKIYPDELRKAHEKIFNA